MARNVTLMAELLVAEPVNEGALVVRASAALQSIPVVLRVNRVEAQSAPTSEPDEDATKEEP